MIDDSTLPDEIDTVLRRLDDVSMQFAVIGQVELPGLPRVLDATNRLRLALRLRDTKGKLAAAEVFDVGVLQTLTESLESLLKVPDWPGFPVLDLAHEIEKLVSSKMQALSFRSFGENPVPDSDEIFTAALIAGTDIELEQKLISQRNWVSTIVDEVQQAAGSVADSELAVAFNEYYVEERNNANNFRKATIAVLLAVPAFAVYSAINVPTSVASSLAHLGIVISGLAAFAYFARESSQHRNAARWAAIMSVQLKTLGAFSADMNVEQREELRSYFGRRVFSELPLSGDNPQPLDQFAPAVQAILDIIKTARGSS